MNTRLRWAIVLLMTATLVRVQTLTLLPDLEMFDGSIPDAWFAPLLSDAIIGLLVPVMVYLFWTKRGTAVWGALIVYNAVGAFDYSHGLATQWTDPIPAETASATTVYLGIGVFMVFQLVALALLFRSDTRTHFCAGARSINGLRDST